MWGSYAIKYTIYLSRESPLNAGANVLDCNIVISEFKLYHDIMFPFGQLLLGKVWALLYI